MTYAGTPSDLAKQPGRTGSAKPLITAIAVLAMIVVAAMASSFVVGSNRVAGLPTPDRAYDQIEAQRGTANFAAVAADRSYDQIEAHRGAATLSVGPTGFSRAQIAAIQAAVGSTGFSRAQIAAIQQSIASAGQSSTSAVPNGATLPQTVGLQGSVSRMVYQTAPHVTLRRTAHKTATPGDHSYDAIENFRANLH